MSKTVTAGFLDAWNAKYGKNGRAYVQYKRRYWTGAAYAYEANWTNLTMRDFSVAGQVVMKLDTPLLNTVKASNVSVKLKNTDYQWLPENQTTGKFKPDAASPTYGYEPFLMQVRVQFGYKKASGSWELVNLFTGVAVDYIFDTGTAEVEVLLSGNEYLLEAADGQLVSDAFTAETLSPVPDGVNKVFTTVSLGVSYISSNSGITDNAAAQIQGTNYTLSNLGVYNTPATVTFALAPTAGHTLKATGRKWKTLQKIEDLIGLLCDQAGIGAGQRSISPALFPGGLSAATTWDSEADFEAGTVGLSIDTRGAAGSIRLFSDLFDDFSGTLAKWTVDFASSVNTSVSITGGRMAFSNSDGFNAQRVMGIHAAQPAAFGTFAWDFKLMNEPIGVNTQDYYSFIDDGSGFGHGKGYYMLVQRNGPAGGGKWYIQVCRSDGTVMIQWSVGASIDTATHTVLITRDNTGLFSFTLDGSLVGTHTDTTYLTSSRFYLQINSNGSATQNCSVDNVSFNHVLSDTWVTAVFDMAAPAAIGLIQDTLTVPANTSISIDTQTSASNTPFNDPDGWKAVGTGNQVLSAVRRYIKIRFTLTRVGAYNITPQLDLAKLNYTTTVILLAMADFTNDTSFSGIQKLAELCDYEWGFDGSGNLFFRSKTPTGGAVVTIDQSRAIGRITDFRPGYDAVLNDGQVTYGNYYAEYNSGNLPEAAPTSQQRFLTKIRQDNYSSFLLAYDVNIAQGRAQLIHDNYYRPRRRMKIKGKIIPQLDLSDIIAVSYFDRPIMKDNIFGDPLQKWPATFGLATNVLVRNVNFKVVGITADPVACTGEYDVQEILS